MLFVGISLVQLQPTSGSSSQAKENPTNESIQEEKVSQNPLLGLVAVILSSLCSGFAGKINDICTICMMLKGLIHPESSHFGE